VART
jgi:hypothetical protein